MLAKSAHPYSIYLFKQYDISRLERVQKRAACFVMSDYSRYSSVSAVITSLNWPTLEQCRNYLKLVILYKIIRGFAVIPSYSLIPLSTSTRGHVQRFKIPPARVNSYLHSF